MGSDFWERGLLMFKKIADNRDQESLSVQSRKRRLGFFQLLLSLLERPIQILDIGGTEEYWKMMEINADDQIFITALNLTQDNVLSLNMTSIAGDARSINAQDNYFDIVFSNSVIEHVGTYQDQLKMVREVHRVGKRYFVQTPNKNFPLEPHFLFQLYQFLPRIIQIWPLRNFRLGWFEKTPDAIKAREIIESIRLLNREKFVELFPQASIYEEKVFGITKSFIAYSEWDK